MTNSQLKLLSQIKKLVKSGNRKFSDRIDRDYVEELLELGITEEEAWNYVLYLNQNCYFPDPMPNSLKMDESLIFKREVNGQMAYIKLKIEKYNNNEVAVCLSFHKDYN